MPLPPPDPAAIAEAERVVRLARERLRNAWGIAEHERALAELAAALDALERLRGGLAKSGPKV
jgi:hypothetical protein